MNRKYLAAAATVLALAALPSQPASADATDAQLTQIADQGLSHSEAMLNASELIDGIGPRLTNSENYDRAAQWAVAKFGHYGLSNVHLEAYDFGLGWNLDAWDARMVQPRAVVMRSIPVAWSQPTGGTLTAPVILAPMSKKEHLEKWRGKLAGKIVMVSLPGEASQSDKPPFRRYEDKDLAAMDAYDLPGDETMPYKEGNKGDLFPLELSRFLKQEGAVAMVRKAYRDNGLVFGEGYLYQPGNALALPFVELSAEDYRRLARLEIAGKPPVIALSVAARFNEQDLTADNVIADIPGSDPKAGYVMAGAHFDSWIAGDGATDDGIPSVLMIEAARIIQSLKVKPKRTIRFALWSGEEEAFTGSTAYIEQHLAHRPVAPNLSPLDYFAEWTGAFPIEKKPGYDELKAYFNLDNGAGKIRGIYAENNVGAGELLGKWLKPFASLGAGTVVMSRTGGTDHEYMQSIGLPGFEFIQDPLDYSSRVHHSNLDTLDHAPPDDVRQAATVLAAMLWQAANSDEVLPRPPLPTAPSKSDPFKVKDPDKE
ncbi:MAG: M20/M25/M40 family metallo-hydrolase [Candidatus Andeanibacterium colombiense]|uniref:Carboxypeptidase Q n=1 Tax=Candidatus Andeanibacterium colombiense TaxID=3121345 RepID=A0AAJ6BND3_9SPHN|nr:MAG: M20/M25/M40 family metallo-hydrolase [Sphingomonadaceae bacterium]